MYVVFDHQGKQYKAQEGDEFLVDLIDAEEGELVEFGRVLMVGGLDGEAALIGTPEVTGARVLAEVVRHERGPKLVNLRVSVGKGSRKRKMGHRQPYTRVLVREIHPE